MENSESDIFVMVVGATVVLLILLAFIISFLFIYKNRQLRNKSEQKQIREKYEQEVLKTQLEIREQTLKNISEEIHDNIGQMLSLVILNLSAVDVESNPVAAQKIEAIGDMIRKIVANLRNLSKTLDADNISKMGMAAMIRMELDLLEKTGLYKTFFYMQGTEKKLDSSREIVIFRIVQESLNNIIKHARASEIRIELNYCDKELAIAIADNGVGFNRTRLTQNGKTYDGAGLQNMERRSRLINAHFTLQSLPAQGTKISLTIPFSHQS